MLKEPSLIINLYNEKVNESLKKLHISIKNKLNFLNLTVVNLGSLISSPENILHIKKILIKDLSKDLEKNINEKYLSKILSLRSNIRLLNSNSISANLNKGYSILMKKNKIIKSVKGVKKNLNLKAKLMDGDIEVNVKKIN